MKRNRKGTTRTGAIPTCMAEVSPERAQRTAWARIIQKWLDVSIREYDRALFDGVQPFARSHPPQGEA